MKYVVVCMMSIWLILGFGFAAEPSEDLERVLQEIFAGHESLLQQDTSFAKNLGEKKDATGGENTKEDSIPLSDQKETVKNSKDEKDKDPKSKEEPKEGDQETEDSAMARQVSQEEPIFVSAPESIVNDSIKVPLNVDSSLGHNAFIGAASYAVGFAVPAGPQGVQPSITLAYNSQQTDMLSAFGYGWDVTAPMIYRRAYKGVDSLYQRDDFAVRGPFGYHELVLVDETEQLYMSTDASHRYRYYRTENGRNVQTTSNGRYYFGGTETTELVHPESQEDIFAWGLRRYENQFGYAMTYDWLQQDGMMHVDSISYGFDANDVPLYTVDFVYETTPISASSYMTQFLQQNYLLLDRIDLVVNETTPRIVRTLDLTYAETNTVFPKLVTAQMRVGEQTLPAHTFGYHQEGASLHRLARIENGQGGITEIDYVPSTLASSQGQVRGNQHRMKTIVQVVQQVRSTDTVTNTTSTVRYAYDDVHYFVNFEDIYEKAYAGFGKVTMRDDENNRYVSYYHQSQYDHTNDSDALLGEFEDHISKKGQLYRHEVYDAQDALYSRTITKREHIDQGDSIFIMHPLQTVSSQYDGRATGVHTAQSFVYDADGFVIEHTSYGEVQEPADNGEFVDVTGDDYRTTVAYASNPSANLRGVGITSLSYDHTDLLLSQVQYEYDDLPYGQVEQGLKTKHRVWFADEQRWLDTSIGYDNGLTKSQTDVLGRTVTYDRDAYGITVLRTTNALGWASDTVYDYALGLVTQTTDQNGYVQRTAYDEFARPVGQYISTPTTSEIQMSRVEYNDDIIPVSYKNISYPGDGTDNELTSLVYIDGFGRELQTRQSSAVDGQYSVVKQSYNSRGNIEFASYARFETGEGYTPIASQEKGNSYVYDVLGRTREQTNQAGTTRIDYAGLVTEYYDETDHLQVQRRDIYGNLVAVREYPDRVYTDAASYLTQYRYNTRNQLVEMIDALGNTRTYTYDSLGRLLTQEQLHDASVTTPGTKQYQYDDANRLVLFTNARGGSVIYTYDQLDRITTLIQKDPQGQTIETTSYQYDSHLLGYEDILTISDAGGTTTYSRDIGYNDYGQTTDVDVHYGSDVYSLAYEYMPRGDIVRVQHPRGDPIVYEYTKGYTSRVLHGQDIVLDEVIYTAHDAYGSLRYANGTTSTYEYDYDYGYRLVAKETISDTVGVIQDLTYTMDSRGNIIRLQDTSPTALAKDVTYSYDALGRLLSASYASGANYSFAYDALGNITHTNTHGAYAYTSELPHAVTQVGDMTYTYDKDGQATDIVRVSGVVGSGTAGSAGTVQKLTYDSMGRQIGLSSDGKQTHYLYDDTGTRIQKQSGQSRSRYIGSDYEERRSQSGDIVATQYVYLGSLKLASVRHIGTETSIIYHHEDHLGGASVDTTSTGSLAFAVDYAPFGAERVTEQYGDYANPYLFGGKELDTESELQYFEARYYDNRIGRFVSQDVVFWEIGQTERGRALMADPQQLNAYAFSRNNPLRYVDPSGENAVDMVKDTIRQITEKASQAAKDAGVSEDVVDAVGDFTEGVMKGDYAEGDSVATTVGQIVGGELPGVGTAADVRDWTAAVDNCKGAGCILDISLATIGFAPVIGAVKHLKKADGIMKNTADKVADVFKQNDAIKDTLKRIENNSPSVKGDSKVFQNFEDKLPSQTDSNYYREWNVKTPGEVGVGPQRIVEGKGGESYFTDDHYNTFTPLN